MSDAAAQKTVSLTIDGVQLTVPEGTLLVEAAKVVRKDIPIYCYHTKLGPAGLCRICLVEVEKLPKLQIACNTVATDGMVVHTASDKTNEGRRAVLEFLLLNHPLDCPICDKGGECDLQDYSMAYGQGASRKIEGKLSKPKAVDLGPTIVLDEERCIVCQRCVRFDDIITREASLVVKDRGHHDIIATATDEAYVSNFSGNVTELCPVGALTSKTYRFKSRPWDLERTKTTCSQCSVGCQLRVDERHGTILRTMLVDDDLVSDGWLCDRGRYNVGFYGDPRRLTSPLLRHGDEWVQIAWDDAIDLWAAKIREAAASPGPHAVAAIGGGRLTNEEAYLLQHIFRALGVENLDWRSGRQMMATPRIAGTYDDLENAQAIVVIGTPPSATAPVLDLRIRKAVSRQGARLIRVGSFGAGSFVPETVVAGVADIPDDALNVERIAIVFDGIELGALERMRARVQPLIDGGKHVSGFIPGEQPNARGAEAMGMLPRSGGLPTWDVFAAAGRGDVRVLSLFGVNPLLRFAGTGLAREALAKTPFVVVSDLFLTETAQAAHLILPARAAFEKDGHVLDMTGQVQRLFAAHAAPAGTLSDGEMLIALAAALDAATPVPHELAQAARTAQGVSGPVVPRDGETGRGSGALRIAVTSHIFAGGGTVAFDESLAELRPQPSATVSARTAASLGASDGDLVDVSAGERTLRDLRLRVAHDAADGVVTVIDGLPGAPAGAFAGGEPVDVTSVRPARTAVATGAAS